VWFCTHTHTHTHTLSLSLLCQNMTISSCHKLRTNAGRAILKLAMRCERWRACSLQIARKTAISSIWTVGFRSLVDARTRQDCGTWLLLLFPLAPFLLPRAGHKSSRIYRSESERDVRSIYRILDSIMSFCVCPVHRICRARSERANESVTLPIVSCRSTFVIM